MSVILKKKPQGEKPFDFRRVETAHDKDWFMPDREPKQKKAEVDGNKNSFDLGQMSSSCQHDLSHVGLTCIMLIPHCSKWELGGDRQVTPYCNVRVFIVPSFQKARYPPGTNIIKRCCAGVLPIPSIISWRVKWKRPISWGEIQTLGRLRKTQGTFSPWPIIT